MSTFAAEVDFGRRSFALFFSLVLICAAVLLSPFQALTGDEPRYLMYATAALDGRFTMALPEWSDLHMRATGVAANWLPVPPGTPLFNSVYVPAVLSPVASVFGLAGLRACSLLVGLFGLLCLFRICARAAEDRAALIAVALAGLSIPLLPYLHLFYMESFLFAAVCCAWDRLQTPSRTTGGHALTAAILMAIPFIQMRGCVVAAALFLWLLWQLYQQGKRSLVVYMLLAASLAGAIFFALNIAIYGGIFGPVLTVRPMPPSAWYSVISMQLFNVRHGLIVYAPVWLLGYVGLIVGAWKGINGSRQGLALAVIAAITGMGINPGECWPARFWILSIPMLTVGLTIVIECGRSVLQRVVLVALTVATLANTVVFIAAPNAMLNNRQAPITWQAMFDAVGHFHPGLLIPVEVTDATTSRAIAFWMIGSAGLILLMAISLLKNNRISAALAGLILVAFVDLTRVEAVAPKDYVMTTRPDGFTLNFEGVSDVRYVQFGNLIETWWVPPWPLLTVETSAPGVIQREAIAANQTLRTRYVGDVNSMSVTSDGGLDVIAKVRDRLVVYRSTSLIRWIANHFA
ncbi:hypothetical protein ACTZWT_10060 [Rhodopseudomonas sp. NSM]|uniref:hypothetical protein n=1 Tax=Rhodopseudomonas sp. NSM TaxID=3457630 RepID=UPI0040354708